MTLLSGKETAVAVKAEIAKIVEDRKNKGKKIPHLAAILVGENPASMAYVNGKVRDCEEVGFESTLIRLPQSISEEQLLDHVRELNHDRDIDGFIVQLPLPKHIDENRVTLTIDPEKDVDGFHPENIGKMVLGLPTFLPATPHGILMLLEHYGIKTSGMHCVVMGRSNIVGTPMSVLMSRNSEPGNCTVTITHSRTQNLKEVCQSADILIAAIGKPGFVTSDMVKDGAIVIDVGINRIQDSTKKSGYRLVGDVDFEAVSEKSSYITPVPGGVGLMTRVALLQNTLIAARKRD
ncbi:MAG: bifunctional 5,10-methylenetetrahydrofolate dehydrogenase/5,10-methenyltetrahydrofolate cyclohydrolase [Bacteroidota bacterium]|nr:bifunctional 5,10-methylenetetrahydrofolate dehydrogenase/5,10-methenyltetrahydrofolate cyclohydrolase [Bacteroidota bacterium]MDX5447130.1 bifunctional 5,10-methylenetetrahydrofolate dehydrogenase/5,10-methenyltetrahydrofolate cyclohydrolase [Bacteroidota bacterium]MDX5506384.1 bifunctional 5,10-methylenetetrahydrofolate dehydrogenase/5,10-methenyltetrahydrofolate cyclohydrolase [Bacteroidota bacterium]